MARASLLGGEAAKAVRPRLVEERASPQAVTTPEAPAPAVPKRSTRAGLKHIGAYLDDAAVEKVALLRARLKLDNSQLIERAIVELYDRQRAEGAFRG